MVAGSRSVVDGQKLGPRRSASAVVIWESLDDIDEELLELADGNTTLATMGILLGMPEARLLERIDRLSRLGLLDDPSKTDEARNGNGLRTRAWAIDTLVDADPPAFDDG